MSEVTSSTHDKLQLLRGGKLVELRLNPEDNPQLQALWSERSTLAEEWTALNTRVLKYKHRTIWLAGPWP